MRTISCGPRRAQALGWLAILSLGTLAGIGCQGKDGRVFHPYGTTRVPPPPTHSYTIPRSYYSNPQPGSTPTPSAPPATSQRPAAPAVPATPGRTFGNAASPMTPTTSRTARLELDGMPVNDATGLIPSATSAPRSTSQPVTRIPGAPGLGFIRRTSWAEPVRTATPASRSAPAPSPPRTSSAPSSAAQPVGTGVAPATASGRANPVQPAIWRGR